MTTDLDQTLMFSAVSSDELYLLQRFYKKNGHKGKARPEDQAFWLRLGDQVLAAIRFSPYANGLLMRGLWVHRNYRGQGLGGKLLQQSQAYWTTQPCYCFAYRHLEAFYRELGFTHPDGTAPGKCLEQLERYRQRGEDLILLQHVPKIEKDML